MKTQLSKEACENRKVVIQVLTVESKLSKVALNVDI